MSHRNRFALALGAALLAGAAPAAAAMTKMVGGAPMYPSKTIVQNAGQAKNLTTLVTAVKAAGLVDTLSGPGPFTVFAPTNAAFGKLPAGTVQGLLAPARKSALTQVLTYHVVPGRLTARALDKMVREGHGKAMLKTVEGGDLTVTRRGRGLDVADDKGDVARITEADVMQKNGVVHVIDKVLMP